MDPVAYELQWWAVGEYAEVVRQAQRQWGQQWSKRKARAVVAKRIAEQFAQTKTEPRWLGVGNPLWQPATPQQRNTLRAAIRKNRSLFHGIT